MSCVPPCYRAENRPGGTMGNIVRELRLGTRGSDLALTQSETVADRLRSQGVQIKRVVIRTSGDRSEATSFSSIGPQGVFVREIEKALLDGEVDIAVHSLKDLPTKSPEHLTIAAIPKRFDAADVLLINNSAALEAAENGWLPIRRGASVGTASARRRAWLRHFRGDLVVEPLRGNVPTRIRRLAEQRFDAIVLAAAGIERLQRAGRLPDDLLADVTTVRLDPHRFVPAPAQGALAVQCRRDDEAVHALLTTIDDAPSRAAVIAERDALLAAEGGCDVAFGAYCGAHDGRFRLTVMLERDAQAQTAAAEGLEPNGLARSAWTALEEAFA